METIKHLMNPTVNKKHVPSYSVASFGGNLANTFCADIGADANLLETALLKKFY